MSTDKLKSVEDGLNIIKYIQENKDKIQETIERHGIDTRITGGEEEEGGSSEYSSDNIGRSESKQRYDDVGEKYDKDQNPIDYRRSDPDSKGSEQRVSNTMEWRGSNSDLRSSPMAADMAYRNFRRENTRPSKIGSTEVTWCYPGGRTQISQKNDGDSTDVRPRAQSVPKVEECDPPNKADSEGYVSGSKSDNEVLGKSKDQPKNKFTLYQKYNRIGVKLPISSNSDEFQKRLPKGLTSQFLNTSTPESENYSQGSSIPSYERETTPYRGESVKKGTEKSISSQKQVMESKLSPGATPFVPRSAMRPEERNAPVENALQSASTVSLSEMKTEEGNLDDYIDDWVDNLPDKVYDKMVEESENLKGDEGQPLNSPLFKLCVTIIHQNKYLIDRINELEEQIKKQNLVSEKLESLERQVAKNGLALSTLEGHLSSLLIMIPGKSAQEEHGKQSSESKLNPDFRLAAGRQVEAQKELLTLDRPASSTGSYRSKIREDLILEPVNMDVTNATQFVPQMTYTSIGVIRNIIRENIYDESLRDELLHILSNIKTEQDLGHFMETINDIIDMQTEDRG